VGHRNKGFLVWVVAFVALFSALYVLAFRLQAFGYAPSSWWVKDVYHYKEWLAEQQPSPRILVLGGSGAMFGVDSAALNEATGLPVVNLSTHALLSLDFLLETVEPHLRSGDLVVMPLEHYYFFAPEQRTLWFINNMLAWGWDGYLDRKSLMENFDFLRAVPPGRIVQGLWGMKRRIPLTKPEQIVEFGSQAGSEGNWNGYSYKSMNETAEYSVGLPRQDKLVEEIKRGWSFFSKPPTNAFIDKFKEIEQITSDAGARLMLVWPAHARNPRFDMSNPEHLARNDRRFLGPLAAAGVTIHCSPGLFNYDLKFFYDSEYHLNRMGRALNTDTLGLCIRGLLNGEPPLSTPDAVEFVKAREQQLLQEFEKTGIVASD